jgi:hypothetical protein
MWKVAYHEEAKAAVAFVQINNPWAKISKEDILCVDICDRIKWIDFQTDDIKHGYTYCCDVNSLRKTISYVPRLNYSKILSESSESDFNQSNETEEDGSNEEDSVEDDGDEEDNGDDTNSSSEEA